jgi:malonyl-CoA decarboxylase
MEKPSFLKRLFDSVTPRGSGTPKIERDARRVAEICIALLSERGEVSGARLAREAVEAYQELDGAALHAFFDVLADEFSPDPETVNLYAELYRNEPTQQNLTKLTRAVEAPRQQLFRRLNMAPGGTAVLLEMRRLILKELRGKPHWVGVESDLAHLFNSWFNLGFLVLQRIDWNTSALILEKLIQYEAVHRIAGWRDLRRRLQADRRCYAFFHPALPDEPLIFIEIALTRGMSARVQTLIDPDSPVSDPSTANCAIFYSITNCQQGLRGISFGNLLIKQVAQDLGRQFPRIGTFATLSPVPGFRAWMTGLADSMRGRAGEAELAELLTRLERANWYEDQQLAPAMQRDLIRLCAYYLLHAKHGQEPLDSVARFHLGNGARLERLNWLGDTSPAGMSRSAGLMVNYVYRLDDVERNHEAYAKDHRVIAARRFEVLAKESLAARSEPARAEPKPREAAA